MFFYGPRTRTLVQKAWVQTEPHHQNKLLALCLRMLKDVIMREIGCSGRAAGGLS